MPGKLKAYKEKGYIGLLAPVSTMDRNSIKDSIANWRKVLGLYSKLVLAQGAELIWIKKFLRSKMTPADSASVLFSLVNEPEIFFMGGDKKVAIYELCKDEGADLKLYGATKASVERAAKKAGFKLEWGKRPAGIDA